MAFENWKTQTINDILAAEFYELVSRNAAHIRKTFPVTLTSCTTLESTQDLLARNIEKQQNGDGYFFYLRNLDTQKLIGFVCVKNVNKTIRKCELAYFVDQDFEGQGIISKAVAQTVDYCFSTLNMNKVFICTSKINAASQRIATKHGFREEGVLREEFKNADAVLEDIVYFGLLQSEYKK